MPRPRRTGSPRRKARATLEQTLAAYDALELRLAGARLPGGLLGEHTVGLYRDAGFGHLSLAGDGWGLADGVPLLPYAWQNVDGYYYFPRFASLRVPPGTTPVRPRGLLAAHLDHVERTVTADGCTSFVFHIPWTDTPQRAEVIDEPLDRLTDDPRVWCASPNDVAWWMIGHPADFPAVHHRDAPPAW
ncbi:polysaccharide deacetylase family protein [Streptomyces nigrescens]|uniref:hypothetical protein n=1 Tax=Streptomyces nigrescens TaxID=1920 RepID=UPI00225189D6|nr:hypothetical protein [Streptomyces libani]MCX5446363.1 hypothetical protein [Streptomyces libani]